MPIANVTNKLMITPRTREWCKMPYPGHPNGCPMFDKRAECPPQAPMVDNFIDLCQPHFFCYTHFNLKEHKERMKKLHPEWSEKQLTCCLYWQNTVRKNLTKEVEEFIKCHSTYIYTLLPEAMGVNVICTARKAGINIVAKPKDIICKIALVGKTKKKVVSLDNFS